MSPNFSATGEKKKY